jgi:hypothetical protein
LIGAALAGETPGLNEAIGVAAGAVSTVAGALVGIFNGN